MSADVTIRVVTAAAFARAIKVHRWKALDYLETWEELDIVERVEGGWAITNNGHEVLSAYLRAIRSLGGQCDA